MGREPDMGREPRAGRKPRVGGKRPLGRFRQQGTRTRGRKEGGQMSIHASSMDLQVSTNLEPIRFDAPEAAPSTEVVADWTTGLPVFNGKRMMLRELVKTDAASLLSM